MASTAPARGWTLLAVDSQGTLVVIELKRDDSGADAYWQAVKYASYLRHANVDTIAEMLADYAGISKEDAGDRLLKHLDADDFESLNREQRGNQLQSWLFPSNHHIGKP